MLMNGKEANNLIINGHRYVIGDLIGKKVKADGYYKLASSVDLDTGLPNPYSASDSQTVPSEAMTIVAQIRNINGGFTIYTEYPAKELGDASSGGWIDTANLTFVDSNGGVNSPSYLLIIYNVREVAPLC